ncbi:MAG: NAD(P)/FAD-dependent oxidoreductase [Clostridia bacterium]
MYDVIVIGGGVTRCSIARELSKYKLSICLVEKHEDVAAVTSRANSAIVHAGYDCKPGTLMALLNVEGNRLYGQMCEELDVPFQRIGSMVVAFDDGDMEKIHHLYKQGNKNGVPGLEILKGDDIRKREPNLNTEIIGALWAPTGGITCPYELTLALAENVVLNGVKLLLNWEVTSIKQDSRGIFTVYNNSRYIEGKYIVNAAGLHADSINERLQGEPFAIKPLKGEYLLLDRSEGKTVQTVVFQTPSPMWKGVLVTPTVDGNLLLGPTAEDLKDKENTSTTAGGLNEVIRLAQRSVKGLKLRKVITSFAGLRAVADKGDFIIEASKKVKGLIHVAGICSPGLSCAPAFGPYVARIMKEEGLEMLMKQEYYPYRKAIRSFRDMDWTEREEAIKQNPMYGRVICRCETVTEAEIVGALHRPVPANSLDGVKRRTRAGMGRCQGGFCSPKVMELIKREKRVEFNQIAKFGGNSWIVADMLKEDKRIKEVEP